jgi:putative oxidoreductase
MANWNTRTAAFLLAGLTLVINLFMHDFWNDYPGGNPQHEMQNFIKNLGIFAGLLLLAARRPGQPTR